MQSQSRFSQSNKMVSLGATAQAYTTGQVVGVPTKIANAVMDPGGTGILESLCLVDKENKKIAVDLYFFQRKPTTQGADAATFALSAAEMLFVCVRISVVAGDYASSSVAAEATKTNLFSCLAAAQGSQLGMAGQGSKDIWVLAVARGSLTFSSADSLWLRAGIVQD